MGSEMCIRDRCSRELDNRIAYRHIEMGAPCMILLLLYSMFVFVFIDVCFGCKVVNCLLLHKGVVVL